MSSLARSFLLGLMLCFGIKPKSQLALRPASHFWWMLLLGIPMTIAVQWWQVGTNALFSLEGLQSDALSALLLLGGATLLVKLWRADHLAFSLAALLMAVSFWFSPSYELLIRGLRQVLPNEALLRSSALAIGLAWWTFCVVRTSAFVLPRAPALPRIAGALALAALSLAPVLIRQLPQRAYVQADNAKLYEDEAQIAEPQPSFNPEEVMYAQRNLVARELAAIRPGVLGTPELFMLAFAADGSEGVFLNEVQYARSLFERRFGARERTALLVNHPRTTSQFALASVSNLRAMLKGIALKMNLEEDILFLFVTTHGSPDHQLLVQMTPLPLNQLQPTDLKAALADAGIRFRVVLVSACYSGGFLDALSDAGSVVMTAARADRPSFGCGAQSELTYFGRAYLVEALNRTEVFVEAFDLARKIVTRREKAEGFDPSDPQIRVGTRALAALSRWQGNFIAGDPVPFFPAPENTPP